MTRPGRNPTAGSAQAVTAWDAGLAVLTTVRRWRSEQKLSPGKPLAKVTVRAAAEVATQATAVLADIMAAGRMEVLEITPDESLASGEVFLDSADPKSADPKSADPKSAEQKSAEQPPQS